MHALCPSPPLHLTSDLDCVALFVLLTGASQAWFSIYHPAQTDMTATQTRRTHSKTKLSLSLPAAAAMNQELPSEIPLLQSENANGETNPTPGSSQDVPFQWPFSAQGPPSPVPPSSPSQVCCYLSLRCFAET